MGAKVDFDASNGCDFPTRATVKSIADPVRDSDPAGGTKVELCCLIQPQDGSSVWGSAAARPGAALDDPLRSTGVLAMAALTFRPGT